MRLAHVVALVAMFVARVSSAADDDECGGAVDKVIEVKLTFAELPEAAFNARIAALKKEVPAVIAVSASEHAALVRVGREQFEALSHRETEFNAERWAPLVNTPLMVLDVTGRPRLEGPMGGPAWQPKTSTSRRELYLVKLVSPFVADDQTFSQTLATRLGVAQADIDQYAAESYSPLQVHQFMLTPNEAARVARMREVRWVGAMQPVLKLSYRLAQLRCPLSRPEEIDRFLAAVKSRQLVNFAVRADDSQRVRALLPGATNDAGWYSVSGSLELMRRLAVLNETIQIEEYIPASL